MIHGIIKTFKHSQSIQFLQIIKILLFLLLIQQGAFSYKITSVKQSYSLQTEVKSFTENLEPINNPIEWQPISFIAKEGARVKKGDVVVEFDTSALAFRLETKRLDQAIIDKDLQTRLNDIDTKESQMLETLNTLNEQLEILLAQQQLFMSIPREEDIRMAEGRLKVAKMNMDASSSDLEKAEFRLRKKNDLTH
jgi:multidrug efflux pump subunit AcrA (membrane-fusion protein)